MLGALNNWYPPAKTPSNPRGMFYDPVVERLVADTQRSYANKERVMERELRLRSDLEKARSQNVEPKETKKSKFKRGTPKPTTKFLGDITGQSPTRPGVRGAFNMPVSGVRWIPEGTTIGSTSPVVPRVADQLAYWNKQPAKKARAISLSKAAKMVPGKLRAPIAVAGAVAAGAKPILGKLDDYIPLPGMGGIGSSVARAPLPARNVAVPNIPPGTLAFPGTVPTVRSGRSTLLPDNHPSLASKIIKPNLGESSKIGSLWGKVKSPFSYVRNHPVKTGFGVAGTTAALGIGGSVIKNLNEDTTPIETRQLPFGAPAGDTTVTTDTSGTSTLGENDAYGQALDDMDAYYEKMLDYENQKSAAAEERLSAMYSQGDRYAAETAAAMEANTQQINDQDIASFDADLQAEHEALSGGDRGFGAAGTRETEQRLQDQSAAEAQATQDLVQGQQVSMTGLVGAMNATRPLQREEAIRRQQAQAADTQRQLELQRIQSVMGAQLGMAGDLTKMQMQDQQEIAREERATNAVVPALARSEAMAPLQESLMLKFGSGDNDVPPDITEQIDMFLSTGNAYYLNNAQYLMGQYPSDWSPPSEGMNLGMPFVDLPSWMVPGR